MSERKPDHRDVRVRRTPRFGVFLGLGAVAGALVALIAITATPGNPQYPTEQALGFLVALLAPVGALLGGGVAVLIDRRSERRARVVQAELTSGGGDEEVGPAAEREAEPVAEPVEREASAPEDRPAG